MKFIFEIVTLLMIWIVTAPVFAGAQETSSQTVRPGKENSAAESATDAIVYRNTKYGFAFSLPQGWKGYTIVMDSWEASDAQKGVVERGPIVSIRHPDWTKENPRQDIPIMVFTLRQWDSVEHSDFFMNGAAVRPSELGRNRKYAFALPPRFDDSDLAGLKEVEEILQRGSLRPIWSK
jgi:hypothetical protein